ncbi:MAG: alanine--tRNA ligase [Chloroflexota bacterium]|nr:alanine--tRNA ligase [Chloroflexota bacterium]
MNSNEIRDTFLKFFEEKGHTVLSSSSLVPYGDPTLLFTSAGMVQIKPYFTGEAVPSNPRLASCQKCFRTTDIDSVGDAGHLTFFEMLGNFSVGDYFKKEAIAWGWEFVTERLHLPKDRLWITVFLDDDEAEGYWLNLGVPKERIVRCDEKDNFWGPAGETGPCGPCSEIHYDFGPEAGCGKPDCGPSCDCDRFSEIWNLVFTQYNQDEQGKRTPLPKPNIDTGMGLERTAVLMQGKGNVYETDLFAPIMDRISKMSGHKYGESAAINKAMRVVAEHTRAATFLIADGVIPSADDRGSVLRRVLRRAALFGRKLGLEESFLTDIAEVVIRQMGGIYPELASGKNYILKVISLEEEKFSRTLSTGIQILESMVAFRNEIPSELVTIVSHQLQQLRAGGSFGSSLEYLELLKWSDDAIAGRVPFDTVGGVKGWIEAGSIFYKALEAIWERAQIPQTSSSPGRFGISNLSNEDINFIRQQNDIMQNIPHQLSGKEVFFLQDTCGFPKEITAEIAAENGLSVDMEGFEREMEAQRERAREAHKFGLADKSSQQFYNGMALPPTRFVGYDGCSGETQIVALIVDGESVETAQEGQEVDVILAETPFYGEKGGQVGDAGVIQGQNGSIEIYDTVWPTDTLVAHPGKVKSGSIVVNNRVEAKVDPERRLDIARNHTATHLLHAALREVLGEQVRQGGSLVAPDHFRFDYTHLIALSKDELAQVQHMVNENIRRNLPVSSRVMPYQQALDEGALAFFGEKYGDDVRMVQIKDTESSEIISAELCGGTHLRSTGQIGFFHITGEHSVGSGLRRIEAVTGRGAEALAEDSFATLENLAAQLEANSSEVGGKLSAILSEYDAERKRARELEGQLLRKTAESLLAEVRQVNGISVLAAKVSASNMELLRETGDWLKDKLGSAVIVLGAIIDGNPRFLAMVTPDLVSKGIHAGKIVKQVAQVTGGGGGGKPEMAQAGGKDKSKIDEALRLVPNLIL